MIRASLLAIAFCVAAPLAAAAVAPDPKASVRADADKIASRLDPVSAQVLRGNQEAWEHQAQVLADKAATLISDGEATAQELDEVRTSLQDQRRQFLSAIRPDTWKGMRGGWSDGLGTEVLLDLTDDGHAKLGSSSHKVEGGKGICVVEGTAAPDGEDMLITPKDRSGHPIRIHRLGIVLAIEDASVQPGATAPYCQPGGGLSGRYFRIEGAEKVMPWLLY